jgi:hypothetical protein
LNFAAFCVLGAVIVLVDGREDPLLLRWSARIPRNFPMAMLAAIRRASSLV